MEGHHAGIVSASEPLDGVFAQSPSPIRAVCAHCGSSFIQRHWSRRVPGGELLAAGAENPVEVRICPACQREGRLPLGYVHLSGDFVRLHRADVEGVLRREVARARETSPAARIITCDDEGPGNLMITTSTEHLAHRLGRALQKGFGGDLHHGFSHGFKTARVWWRR